MTDVHPRQLTTLESRGPEQTLALGRSFADGLVAGDVVALRGELGAGKTCFIKGIGLGLGIGVAITSPTFTLIHEYRCGRLPLCHIDLYRLDSAAQALAIGIEDYLDGPAVTVIEWPERIEPLLPERVLEVRIEIVDELTRRIQITAPVRP